MDTVVFIIGGNLGDRLKLIHKAKEMLQEKFGEPVLLSSIYETVSWGKTSKNDFFNQVLAFNITYSPQEILITIQSVENELGRERKEKWADRTMDIDILYIGQKTIHTPDLIVPHPLISKRRFVLEPLVEVLPDFIHPVFNLSNKKLLEICEDTTAVRKLQL